MVEEGNLPVSALFNTSLDSIQEWMNKNTRHYGIEFESTSTSTRPLAVLNNMWTL